jgi:hypothetical protein
MILFHGSKAKFDTFDPIYFRSGEGVGSFAGWYFTDNMAGAERHVTSYLRDHKTDGSGYVYECEVPDHYAIENCENGFTDTCYGCQATGVLHENSHHIKILKVIDLSQTT